MNPLIVITDITDLDPAPGVAELEAAGYGVRILDLVNERIVPEEARDAVAAIVGYATVDSAVLDQLPRLQVLATMSTGTDMVDSTAARTRGIEVVPLTAASTNEVAAHAMTLMLAAVRGLPGAQRTVREGGWTDQFSPVPRATEDLTVGLLGYGRIAQAVASCAAAMFGRVIAYDPYAEIVGPVAAVSLEELFHSSDILSLHLPATRETVEIVSAQRLATMPHGAVMVNVSRGELVDEHAVLAALDTGGLSAYAADVLDAEPPAPTHPLRTHPAAIITPHIAYRSDRSLDRYVRQPARNVLDRLGPPRIPAFPTPDRWRSPDE